MIPLKHANVVGFCWFNGIFLHLVNITFNLLIQRDLVVSQCIISFSDLEILDSLQKNRSFIRYFYFDKCERLVTI